jgi:hypothetical protein
MYKYLLHKITAHVNVNIDIKMAPDERYPGCRVFIFIPVYFYLAEKMLVHFIPSTIYVVAFTMYMFIST